MPLSDLDLPSITRVLISSPGGKYIEHQLPLGGFGVSRFMLDDILARIAKREGVVVAEDTKVADVVYRNNSLIIFSSAGKTEATVAAGAIGKRSNLDVKWKRNFTGD